MGTAAAPLFEAPYKRKYHPTPEIDAAIRRAYERQRRGDQAALKTVSRQLGWTRNAVCKRGAELGVSRTKEHAWTVAEEQLLEQFGHLAPSGVSRMMAASGFPRSIAAIQVKLVRDRIKRNLDGYSANSLALAFGVDVHKVLVWIRRGLLKAERRGTMRTEIQGGDIWWIADRAVRQFILRSPGEIDLARVEKMWFLHLITDGKIDHGMSFR